MKRVMQAIMTVGVVAGAWGTTSVSASANSQYSAARSHSVKLVWRKSMKRHTYTATKGARYSKHLGIRYSNNDVTPTVAWYTDAHEKLYRKNKGNSAIYYHVKSADGTLQGWIWRGYLTKAVSTNAATTPTPTTTQTPSTYEAMAKKAILSMGMGAKPDAKTMQLAKTILNDVLESNVHFSSESELFPNTEKNNQNVYLGDLTDNQGFNNITSPGAQFLFNLLKQNGIENMGYGTNKARTYLHIGNKVDMAEDLSSIFTPHSDIWGQQGVTKKNYFVEAKIGAAITRTSDGRMATFAIARFPDKYAKLVVRD